MENHIIPVTMARRIWNLVRVFFLMARKGISSKRKLLLDLNLMLKKGKIAGKALVGSLIFHHRHHNHLYHAPDRTASFSAKEGEYEFSCGDTPAHHAMFNFIHHRLPALHGTATNKHKKGNKRKGKEEVEVGAIECPEVFFDEENYEAINCVLERLALKNGGDAAGPAPQLSSSSNSSSRRVRQLRVTDSPFPLVNNIEDDRRVDEAAEDFINRFYSQLRQQRLTPGPHGVE